MLLALQALFIFSFCQSVSPFVSHSLGLISGMTLFRRPFTLRAHSSFSTPPSSPFQTLLSFSASSSLSVYFALLAARHIQCSSPSRCCSSVFFSRLFLPPILSLCAPRFPRRVSHPLPTLSAHSSHNTPPSPAFIIYLCLCAFSFVSSTRRPVSVPALLSPVTEVHSHYAAHRHRHCPEPSLASPTFSDLVSPVGIVVPTSTVETCTCLPTVTLCICAPLSHCSGRSPIASSLSLLGSILPVAIIVLLLSVTRCTRLLTDTLLYFCVHLSL